MSEIVDVRRLPCPGPVMELRKLLEGGALHTVLHVADDLARSNVSRFAASRGAEVEATPHPGGGFLITVRVPGGVDAASPAPGGDAEPSCALPEAPRGPRVLQVSSDRMGAGDDELGALLMRGFLKTVGKVEPLPDITVFYNRGAALCCEGSPILDDLRALEDAGVTLLACGTCLNFLGLANELRVGRVTDMLEITSTLMEAGHVVRP